MIAAIFKIPLSEVENRTWSEYAEYRDHAANVGSWLHGGELKYTMASEQLEHDRAVIKQLKEQGLLK